MLSRRFGQGASIAQARDVVGGSLWVHWSLAPEAMLTPHRFHGSKLPRKVPRNLTHGMETPDFPGL